MQDLHELSGLIERHASADGVTATPVPRVALLRSSAPTTPLHTLYDPSICLVAQGRKRACLAGVEYLYRACEYLIVGVDLPVIGAVIEASANAPYLCFKLQLDRSVLVDMLPGQQGERSGPPISIAPATPELIDAAVRMLRLLDTPDDIGALAPLIEREILHRLLNGPQGAILRQIAVVESRLSRMRDAIQYLAEHFHEPFSVEDLAGRVGMSLSSFHDQFRQTTMMTPLQFRNHLRFQEVRRLMLSEGLSAAEAGFRVGYESPSQLSRDYARIHGMPPKQDVARLKRLLTAEAAVGV
ncbi:AraC family transcriptional regulator [Modicisalibacter radicis]|uniref:AraC family transcriptional regulator n=1 Tax=Halomonas sp. EAR18 TaxID=2518972 RepID=UPI00109CC5E8|nr:AraC family transcriptional regulator [Halomonas sp. EAR18]